VPIYRPSLLNAALVARGGAEPAALTAPSAGALELHGAWPNPFAKQTTLHFTLAKAGPVSLRLYNVAGQRVATLVDGFVSAGEQSVPLDAGSLAPGIYFATLRGAGGSVTRSVVLAP
jgi:hypothetical protein